MFINLYPVKLPDHCTITARVGMISRPDIGIDFGWIDALSTALEVSTTNGSTVFVVEVLTSIR
ncbi:MAG: hypothetical protein E4H27_04175 [Anaerolineales bacterium]|nr:MAG: hypothetical protein E4H27_04175 [Anaerolineales bacterium]